MRVFLYRTEQGVVAEQEENLYLLEGCDWNDIFVQEDPRHYVLGLIEKAVASAKSDIDAFSLLPLVVAQEVWAAGVTYKRSREVDAGSLAKSSFGRIARGGCGTFLHSQRVCASS